MRAMIQNVHNVQLHVHQDLNMCALRPLRSTKRKLNNMPDTMKYGYFLNFVVLFKCIVKS